HLKVAAHIFYLDDAKMLVTAGLDGLAHSVRDKPVDDELIATMKKHGAWQLAATLTREYSTFAFAKPSPPLNDPFFDPAVSDAGLTPRQIITIATKSSAEFLDAKDLGTLEKGKWADMVVLTRNPLDNIKNTRSIESVWIAGTKVK